jgi:hypothetical protein
MDNDDDEVLDVYTLEDTRSRTVTA